MEPWAIAIVVAVVVVLAVIAIVVWMRKRRAGSVVAVHRGHEQGRGRVA